MSLALIMGVNRLREVVTMKYCLNIEELFQDLDFYDKFKAAKDAGYDYVEFWGWHGRDIKRIKEECDKNGIKITGFKGDLDWSLCDGSTQKEFLDWTEKSIETAKYFECDSIIVHSNSIFDDGSSDFNDTYSYERQIANITSTLMKAAPVLEKNGIKMYVEPLNNLDHLKGMFLVNAGITADIVRAVGSPNVKMLCDLFHMQIMHGDLAKYMLKNLDIMDYIHIADAPDRGEPGTGEINYAFLLNTLKEHGFEGVACFELTPTGTTEKVLEAIDVLRKQVK